MSPNSGILVVNGIFGAILSHELFVGRRLPFLVLGILREQKDNLSVTRLRQPRRDLMRNGKERLVLELCIELNLPHGQRLRSSSSFVNCWMPGLLHPHYVGCYLTDQDGNAVG